MSCNHSRTKMKMVAWATESQGEHEQGFSHELCCAECGCKVDAPTEVEVRSMMCSFEFMSDVMLWLKSLNK